MPKPRPIHTRKKDERSLDTIVRSRYVLPFLDRIERALREATTEAEALRAIQAIIASAPNPDIVAKEYSRAAAWHRQRLLRTFRAAFGIDVSKILTEPAIEQFMDEKIRTTTELIQTVPERIKDGLASKITIAFQEAPFDQNILTNIIGEVAGTASWNTRRITRDQTTKLISGLTRIRHEQCGINKYEWLTSEDERVRPTHQANNKLIFSYAEPPAVTGNPGDDILCRCVAIPVIDGFNRILGRKAWLYTIARQPMRRHPHFH